MSDLERSAQQIMDEALEVCAQVAAAHARHVEARVCASPTPHERLLSEVSPERLAAAGAADLLGMNTPIINTLRPTSY